MLSYLLCKAIVAVASPSAAVGDLERLSTSSNQQAEQDLQVCHVITYEFENHLTSLVLLPVFGSSRQGRVSDTSSKSMGQTLQKVIAAASAAQAEFGDSFVSTEHLLLALAREDTRFTKKALKDQARGEQEVLEAVKNIRGPQKVTSRNPEAAYEVCYNTN